MPLVKSDSTDRYKIVAPESPNMTVHVLIVDNTHQLVQH